MDLIGYSQFVPVIVALVQIVKVSFSNKSNAKIIKRFSPLISLFFGILLSVSMYGIGAEVAMNGLMTGLIASGLYSGGKSLLNIKK